MDVADDECNYDFGAICNRRCVAPMHVSITTFRPFVSARAAASSLDTPI